MSKKKKKNGQTTDSTLIKYLINILIFFILAAIFVVLLVISIGKYDSSIYIKDDLLPAIYTFSRYETITSKDNDTSFEYLIYVEEEPDPLIINSIAAEAVDKDMLDEIQMGEMVQCFLIPEVDEKLEIAELHYEGSRILTLESYERTQDNNAVIGIFLMSILALVSAGIAIYFVNKYLNRRDKIKGKK